MREFLAKHEILWILPLTFLVAIFSVYGLHSFDKTKASTTEILVPLSEISGFTKPFESSEIYCATETLVKDMNLVSQEKYTRIVFDPYYHEGAYVSIDTVCKKASIGFLADFSDKGYFIPSYLRDGK